MVGDPRSKQTPKSLAHDTKTSIQSFGCCFDAVIEMRRHLSRNQQENEELTCARDVAVGWLGGAALGYRHEDPSNQS